jgi:import receptor subunit TOM20
MVLEMMRLDVSDSPSSAKTDEVPPSALSEDDGSTSRRGPPSETSSQEWDQITDPGSLTPPTA